MSEELRAAKAPTEQSRTTRIFKRVADIKGQSINARDLSEGIRNRIIGNPGKNAEETEKPEPVCFFDKLGTELGDIFDFLKETIDLLQEIEKTFAE